MEKRLETTIVFLGCRVGVLQGLGFRLFRVQVELYRDDRKGNANYYS